MTALTSRAGPLAKVWITSTCRSDDQRRGPVPEQHPRRADVAELVRELLSADNQDRALDFLEDADRLQQAVGKPGAGGDQIGGRMGLEYPQFGGKPGRYRRDQALAGAGAAQDGADLRCGAAGLV